MELRPNLADWAKEIWGGPTIACGGLQDARADTLLLMVTQISVPLAKGPCDPAWPEKILAATNLLRLIPLIKPHATLQNTLDWRAAN